MSRLEDFKAHLDRGENAKAEAAFFRLKTEHARLKERHKALQEEHQLLERANDFTRAVETATLVDHAIEPKEGKGILIYGSGFYRQSKVYLAYIAMEDIEAREPIDGMTDRFTPANAYFFAGLDADEKPIWRDDWEAHTADAVALFDMVSPEGEPIHDVGELSVVLDPLTQRVYMAYQSIYDRGVHLRYARRTAVR